MTRIKSPRALACGVAIAAMFLVPTLASAQMAPMPPSSGTPMGHDKMMPMGNGQMEHDMPMPGDAAAKKPGCCGKMDMGPKKMPMKPAKPHKHPAKAKPAPAKPAAQAPMAQPMSGHM
jgi:hypothetical protein